MGRIRYGIKNVHYAVATAGQDESLTYATPVAIPGAKSISLDAQGESVDEYADNVSWWHGDVNNGYSGTLEFEDTAASELFINRLRVHSGRRHRDRQENLDAPLQDLQTADLRSHEGSECIRADAVRQPDLHGSLGG